MPEQVKSCFTCKHVAGVNCDYETWHCQAPENFLGMEAQDFNPVTGKPFPAFKLCVQARASTDGCGPEGRWFQAEYKILVDGTRVSINVPDNWKQIASEVSIVKSPRKLTGVLARLRNLTADDF